MPSEDYFDVIKAAYEALGLKKSQHPVRKFVFFYTLLPLLLVMFVMVLINFKDQTNIYEIVEVFESASTHGQIIIRKLIILIHLQKIEEIINYRSKFWRYDSCGEAFGGKLYKKTQLALIWMKLFWSAGIFALAMIALLPQFSEDRILPNSCWVPNDNQFVYFFIYISQIIFFGESVLLAAVVDGFFLFVCTDLEIQFKLIMRTLQNIQVRDLDEDKCLDKLKECSNHHRFLLKVHKKLESVFSMYFVCQLLLNISVVTIQFYVLSGVPDDLTIIIKSVVYLAAVLLQDSLSVIPASNVRIEAEKLANEIYAVGWYNTPSLKIRKFILFWLLKAQEPLKMTAGGLVAVNRNLFLQVPRISFSITTLLQ